MVVRIIGVLFFLVILVAGIVVVHDTIIRNQTSSLNDYSPEVEECRTAIMESFYYNDDGRLVIILNVDGERRDVPPLESNWINLVEMTRRVDGKRVMYCDDGPQSGLYSLHDYIEI